MKTSAITKIQQYSTWISKYVCQSKRSMIWILATRWGLCLHFLWWSPSRLIVLMCVRICSLDALKIYGTRCLLWLGYRHNKTKRPKFPRKWLLQSRLIRDGLRCAIFSHKTKERLLKSNVVTQRQVVNEKCYWINSFYSSVKRDIYFFQFLIMLSSDKSTSQVATNPSPSLWLM